ncbi:unnamed protein product [Pylaiella littoralis]
MVGGTIVSHKSSTQPIVSNSSVESECIAAREGVRDTSFVRHVLSSIAPKTSGSTIKVLEDNEGAMALIQNLLSFGVANKSTCASILFGSSDRGPSRSSTSEPRSSAPTFSPRR